MTLSQRALAGAVLAVAFAATGASAGTVVVPVAGCSIRVTYPTVTMYPSVPPAVGISGVTDVWSDCP